MEHIVTVKAQVSIMAESRMEADSESLDYFLGLMSVGDCEVLDIHEVPESARGDKADGRGDG